MISCGITPNYIMGDCFISFLDYKGRHTLAEGRMGHAKGQKCYTRQVATYEKRKGTWARWQETTHLVNSAGPWTTKKAGTSRLTGKHTFWGGKCPEGRQNKWEKARISSL